MKRIVVLISGQGSNMEALVHACRRERWPAQVVAVVSNRPQAGGLALAEGMKVPTVVVDHQQFASREAFDMALAAAIDKYLPDLVLLAGFMRVLTPAFVQRYEGRMLNIHPSLLPAFPGLHTHRRALEVGCKFAGATVHGVSSELDHGPIVIQAAVPVRPGDDAATLGARVLEVEHLIYPRAVQWWVRGRLRVDHGVVTQLDGEAQWLVRDSVRPATPT
jgi:phosphoribosylglycinamide formyltransferase-1